MSTLGRVTPVTQEMAGLFGQVSIQGEIVSLMSNIYLSVAERKTGQTIPEMPSASCLGNKEPRKRIPSDNGVNKDKHTYSLLNVPAKM